MYYFLLTSKIYFYFLFLYINIRAYCYYLYTYLVSLGGFQIGTGFSDEDLQKHAEFFKEHIIPKPKPYYRYDTSHEPDHWFDTVQVWEIKCADLSLSPAHRAAIGIVSKLKIIVQIKH